MNVKVSRRLLWGGSLLASLLSTSPAGAGNFTFRPPVVVPMQAPDYVYDVALGDMNGDGRLDLVVAILPQDPSTSRVLIKLSNGDGTFQPPSVANALGQIRDVVVGDLDADGDLDVVAAYGSTRFSVFPGLGDGRLGPRTDIDVGAAFASVALGDADLDGALDVVVPAHASNTVVVVPGNGDLTFDSPVTHPVATDPMNVIVAELSGDGVPDLAVACKDFNAVAVLRGTGGGAFAPFVPYFTGEYASGLASADLNGDGARDLVSTSWSYSTLSVLRNHGQGTFGGKRDYTSGTGYGNPSDVSIGDLDQDGWLDLVASNPSGTLAVHFNRGNGTFTRRVTYACGEHRNVELGDLNGDGVLDAVVSNSTVLTVLFGTLTTP